MSPGSHCRCVFIDAIEFVRRSRRRHYRRGGNRVSNRNILILAPLEGERVQRNWTRCPIPLTNSEVPPTNPPASRIQGNPLWKKRSDTLYNSAGQLRWPFFHSRSPSNLWNPGHGHAGESASCAGQTLSIHGLSKSSLEKGRGGHGARGGDVRGPGSGRGGSPRLPGAQAKQKPASHMQVTWKHSEGPAFRARGSPGIS